MMTWGKIRRTGVLAGALCVAGGMLVLAHAQDRGAEKNSQSQQSPKSAAKNEHPQEPQKRHAPIEEAQGRGGFGAQLAHETREETGQEANDKTQFQESPSVRLVARLTGLSVQHAALASTLLNFAIMAAIIIWALAKYLPGLFRNRTSEIQKAMQEAQKASAEARRRLAEIESRLGKLDVEIGMMRDAAEKDAAAEEERIRAAAEEDARKIVEGAEQEISAATKAAQRSLIAFAADLAVGLAKKQIHIDSGTDQALVHTFTDDLTSPTTAAGKDRH
jgi:F-type H+-transporting ATPase subunit b